MSWSTVRPQLQTLLESIELDGGSAFVEIKSFPKLDFSGYPSAYIIPSDQESDYETTIENQRFYSFFIRIFYETRDTTVEVALNKLEEAVDAVMDAIDKEDKKTSGRVVGINLPTDYVYLSIDAAPSAWGELPTEALIMAEIKVRVRISYDASQ